MIRYLLKFTTGRSAQQSVHWTLGIPRHFKHFSGFKLSLLPSRVHARPSASNAIRWAAILS